MYVNFVASGNYGGATSWERQTGRERESERKRKRETERERETERQREKSDNRESQDEFREGGLSFFYPFVYLSIALVHQEEAPVITERPGGLRCNRKWPCPCECNTPAH